MNGLTFAAGKRWFNLKRTVTGLSQLMPPRDAAAAAAVQPPGLLSYSDLLYTPAAGVFADEMLAARTVAAQVHIIIIQAR